ncbi:MAG: hypothetical protein LBL97_08930, partial [Prevotellaceae bacterium]|nr:hypothetical protein [Prevotellaceae bacterium]
VFVSIVLLLINSVLNLCSSKSLFVFGFYRVSYFVGAKVCFVQQACKNNQLTACFILPFFFFDIGMAKGVGQRGSAKRRGVSGSWWWGGGAARCFMARLF